MSVSRKNIEFAKRIFTDRLGDDYVYGGTWDPFNLNTGCDCSGLTTDINSAVFHGTGMIWGRQGISTESYRYKPYGPYVVAGVFPLIHVPSPSAIPPSAVLRINLHHEGAGGPDSHTQCVLDGMVMESSGSHGTCTRPGGAIDPNSAYWNDWWYLDGPIAEDMNPDLTYTYVVAQFL